MSLPTVARPVTLSYSFVPYARNFHRLRNWQICTRLSVPNLAPIAVVLNTVDGQGNHLNASLLKLLADTGCTGQLSGADRGEVPWVGEQYTPPTDERDKMGFTLLQQ